MGKTKEFIEEDYEYEALRDSIYQLEWKKEMEAAWQEVEYYQTKIEVIKKHETKYKRKSFRRTYKKLSILRSHLPSEPHRTAI